MSARVRRAGSSVAAGSAAASRDAAAALDGDVAPGDGTGGTVPSSTVDIAIAEVVDGLWIIDQVGQLVAGAIQEARRGGLSWREVAERLQARGVTCSVSGLHRRYGGQRGG